MRALSLSASHVPSAVGLLHHRRQVLDPRLERATVALAHRNVHVPRVVVDQRLPQRGEVSPQQ
jgi:hypothetical protein